MKVSHILSLLFISCGYVYAYEDCVYCNEVTFEEGLSWGVENNDWCIIRSSNCDKNLEKNQCFAFPEYNCCTGCEVIEEDADGKWGVENNDWCAIKDTCFKKEEDTIKENLCMSPLVKSMYTADPAPMVHGDTLYVYTTHDENNLKDNFYTMYDWYVFSTKDMKNWTNHGKIFSLNDISWADDRAWAPQAIYRNNKFYLYTPVHKINGGMAISVAVSDSPTGPFKDLGRPLVDEGDWNDIDPTVFIDDDGQAYLYFGNPELRYVLLNEDMISYNRSVGIRKIQMSTDAFGYRGNGSTTYGEGPYFYKRNGIYYMVYAAFRQGQGNESLGYSTSKSPTGPWKYGGVLMTEEGGAFTNHPGIVDFKGHSYLFYHTRELPGGGDFHRSTSYTEFTYNSDGSINTIPKCSKGPNKQVYTNV